MAIERGAFEPRMPALPGRIQTSRKRSGGSQGAGRVGKAGTFGAQEQNLVGFLRSWNPVRKDAQHLKKLANKLKKKILEEEQEGDETSSDPIEEMKAALQELDFRISTKTQMSEQEREAAIRGLMILQEEVENQSFVASLRRTLYRA